LSGSPKIGTFYAIELSPESRALKFAPDCIDEASGADLIGMASKGTLGITGKSYDPGVKSNKL
jgi:hypothetical protein